MILAETPTTIHYIWRAHNHSFLLNSDDSKKRYLQLLAQYKKKYDIEIYGYAIMNNHFHALMRVPSRSLWQNFSRTINSQLAVFINKNSNRCGQVVMDRPKTIVLESDRDVLTVLRYIELNPLRAGIVKKLKNYKWSSFLHHVGEKIDDLIDACPAFDALGASRKIRAAAYRKMFEIQSCLQDMARRRDFIDVHFIGSPGWIAEKVSRLREMMRKKPPPE